MRASVAHGKYISALVALVYDNHRFGKAMKPSETHNEGVDKQHTILRCMLVAWLVIAGLHLILKACLSGARTNTKLMFFHFLRCLIRLASDICSQEYRSPITSSLLLHKVVKLVQNLPHDEQRYI